MTDQQIKEAIRSSWPFFAVTRRGDVLARYVFMGPVLRWSWNQMIPTPLQDEDLVWLLQAADEDGRAITPPADSGKKT
ncbi:hypothetical protein [Azovibrio restrictus]|uniref:hypothetical protein n=1 Tax=Azovibrio restrictus TaxID=146938 RepID=UPI00040876F4|nr:hypothetical protein [Azovibrio restrictus]